MDFFDVVSSRYSYRGEFLDRTIPDEHVRKILTAGIQAPSGYNLQTTSFIVVTDPAIRAAIAAVMPTPATRTAPLMIVPISQNEEKDGLSFEIEDYGISSENLLLAITALGYASVLMDGYVKLGAGKAIAEILGVPADYTVRAVLPVGVPKDPGAQAPRKPFEERVHFDKF